MTADVSNYLATQRGAVSTIDTTNSSDALLSGQQNLSSSYNTFLQLLTAQLKNQDPLSPMDTNSFTQQLVQMTGVQQQLLSNTLLKQLVTQGANGGVGDALGLLGKTVTAVSSDAAFSGGKADWTYSLPSTATDATLTVKDSTGKVVWTGKAPDFTAGDHAFSWNGVDTSGSQVGKEGDAYTLQVAAKDASGDLATTISIQGVVKSVRQTDAGPEIDIGGVDALLSGVTAVQG